jgi:hypothetical protein
MVTAFSDHQIDRLPPLGVDSAAPPSTTRDFEIGRLAGVDRIAEILISEFPTASPDGVRTLVEGIAARYRNARISSYVAIIVERESRDQLRLAGLPRQRAWRDDRH